MATPRYIAAMPYSPFEPEHRAAKRRRFRLIPVRMLLPNLITLLALCAGLTAIRLAVEERLEWAVAAIVFAVQMHNNVDTGFDFCFKGALGLIG